jgi:porin
MGLCLRTCLMAGAILCILGEGVQGQEPDAPSPGGRPTSGPVPASSPTTAAAGEDEVATWLGLRPRLTEAGVTPILSYILDSSRNFRGGLNTHDWALRHLLTAGLDMDMEKVAGIKGGEFYATFIDHHGSNGSALTGDIQMYSSIDANSRDELYEVWYQQKLLDDKLRLKVGKIDATKEFAFTDNGADFLSSPMGFSPALVDFPTYPDPTYGLSIYAYPSDWLYAGFGYFDRGLQEEWPVGSPAPVNSGQFLIGEVGAKWKLGANELPGRLGLGAYGHTGTFEEFGGGRPVRGVRSDALAAIAAGQRR